jgi:hypothetical protein
MTGQNSSTADLLGGVVAVSIYFLCILVFIARLAGLRSLEHWLGIFLLATFIPLVYLLLVAPQLGRPPLYYVQIGLMICFLLAELVLDYVLKVDFRQVQWMVVAYVMLFFAGTGGMIGVATHAGKPWTVAGVILFIAMGVLAFVQRIRTGI